MRAVKSEPQHLPAVGNEIWDGIRSEFGLLEQDEFEAHFETLFNDPEPLLRQAVRVFIDEDTLFPGFQIVGGALSPAILALFDEALELQVPHNVSAAWMVTPPARSRQPAPRGSAHDKSAPSDTRRSRRQLAKVQNFGAIPRPEGSLSPQALIPTGEPATNKPTSRPLCTRCWNHPSRTDTSDLWGRTTS